MADIRLLLLFASIWFQFSYNFIYLYVCRPPAGKMNNLNAVSRFEDVETYYRGLRFITLGQRPQESGTAKEKMTVRKNVCKSIISSYYFEMRLEEYVNVDAEEIREELKNEYPDIFHSIYKESENPPYPLVRNDIRNYEYENDYKVRTVRVLGSNFDEYVITCLARGSLSKRIKAYYASQPYNVNSALASGNDINGRFIFSRHTNNASSLLALAEESAYQWETLQKLRLISLDYMTMRIMGPRLAPQPSVDPVCRLTPASKLRMCTSLFGATMFRRKGFKFTPTRRNVLGNCVKKKIVLLDPIFNGIPLLEQLERTIRRQFRSREEWTIGCKVSTAGGDRVFFYVSAAVSSNEVFVYTRSNVPGHIALFNGFMNLSVVGQLSSYAGEAVEIFNFDDVED